MQVVNHVLPVNLFVHMEDRVARLLVAVLGNAGEVKTIEHLNRFMAALDVLAEQILPLAVNYCSNLSSDRNSV